MTRTERLEKEQQRAQERWNKLREQIKPVQDQRDGETRAEEKMRLDRLLTPWCVELAEVERELERLEADLRKEKAEALVRDARERERKQAYDQAIMRWREIADLSLDRWNAAKEIERLEALKAQAVQRSALVRELGKRQAEIGTAYLRLVSLLRKPEDPLLLEVQPLIEDFVRREISGVDLATSFDSLRSDASASASNTAASFDFAANLRRLQRGEIALFLGADLPNDFDSQQPTSQKLAEALAEEMHLSEPPDSLSTVAEHYAIMHGPASLVRSMSKRLPTTTANPLYALLARTLEPLLLIVAGHDSLLEEEFRQAGRRFATISLVVSAMADFRPGQIILHYSDRDQPLAPCLADDLSKHLLMEEGYSVIFKIRGSCLSPPDARDLCSLVLWEHRHFDFARNVDKLLPSYFSRQLATRGFWFLGFAPARWEERFLASVILESRRSPEPAIVVRREVKEFEAAYWQRCHAVRQDFALPEFVQQLEAAR